MPESTEMVSENKNFTENQDLIKTQSNTSLKTEGDTKLPSLEQTNPSSVDESPTVSAGATPADLTTGSFPLKEPIHAPSKEGNSVYSDNKNSEDRYQILKELGEGGMGVVQLVQDRILGREVALKKIRCYSLNQKEPSLVQKNLLWRLRKEAEYTAILEHPHIVPLYDMEKKANGEIYFTMRKIEGKTLSHLLKEKRAGNSEYSENRLLSIFEKVCDAVRYAHSRQIVHRDLKPSNIMVGTFGEVYVVDWGIAKKLDQTTEEHLSAETFLHEEKVKSFQTVGGLGTPGYMPPEQRKNASKVDIRADIFALGKILRECFTCFSPNEEFQEILRFYENRKSSSTSAGNPEKRWEELIPFDVQAIIRKASADKITDRYASVEALLEDLDRYQKNIQVSARRYTLREILWKWTQRHWKPLLSGILILLTLSSFVFYQQWLQRRESQKRLDLMKKEADQKWARAIQNAEQEEEEAAKILEAGNQESARKVIHLLNALNHLNTALQIYPQHSVSEHKKVKIGKLLMQLCYATRDYKLAYYVAQELGSLSILNLEEKQSLVQDVEVERTRILKEHFQVFKTWEKKFREGTSTYGEADDAIFDISKMSEEEILTELLAIVEESEAYFFQKKDRHNKKEEFFKVMILATGRLENPKAGKRLFETLKRMSQKMLPIPLSQRPVAETDYLITLAQALGYSNLTGVAREFHQLRWELGKNGRFWSATESVFKKLALLDNLSQLPTVSAEDYYTRGLLKLESQDYKGAIADFTEALQRNPQFVNAYIRRGWAEDGLSHYAEALENYNQAIQFQPNRADIYNDRGLIKHRLKDYQGAILDYDTALQLVPSFLVIYNNRALSKMYLGKLDDALQDCNKAIEIDPQFSGAYQTRGDILQKRGDIQGALSDYNQSVKLNPENASMISNRGAIRAKIKDFDGAIDDFSRAIYLNPQQAGYYFNRGFSKYEMRDFEGAIQDFNETLRLIPSHGNAYFLRGCAKTQLKKFSEAILDFSEAEKWIPEDPDLYRNRAIVCKEIQDIDGAINDCVKAFHLEPKYLQNEVFTLFSEMIFHRSALAYRHKQFLDAKKDLLRLQGVMPPNHPLRAKVQKMLQQLEKEIESTEENK